MARGQKICPKCKTTTGPRSWHCPNPQCGYGFTVKGIKHPDLDPEDLDNLHVAASPGVKKDQGLRFWSLVDEYDGDDDKRFRKRYGVAGKTWQSKCGQYRVREQYTYMGVDMQGNFSKCVYLLKSRGGNWDVVKPKGKFKTPLAALRRLSKEMNGQKVRATTKAERLEIRVSELMGRKVSYA